MIRPCRILIALGFFICFLLTLLPVLIGGSLFSLIIPISIFALVVGLDLYLSMGRLHFINISTKDRLHGSVNTKFDLPLNFTNKSGSNISLKIIVSQSEWFKKVAPVQFNLLNNESSQISISGMLGQRGIYAVGEISICCVSKFKLWELSRIEKLQEKVSVYPSFSVERKLLYSQLMYDKMLGAHQFRQVGKGKDFERLREYEPGDGYEDISWKATARKNMPITKVYQIEKTQEVYLAIDCSRLSKACFKSKNNIKEEVLIKFIEVAFLLGEFCARNGDKFGLILYSDNIKCFIKAKAGIQHIKLCKDALYNIVSKNESPDYSEIFSEIYERIPKRSMILFLCNLDDVAEAEVFVDNIGLLSKKHLVLVQMMQTAEILRIFSNPVSSLCDIQTALSKHSRWAEIMEIQKDLKVKGVSFELVEESLFSLQAIKSYVMNKQRQAI